jgi:Tol biopolymer transport system component
MDSICVYRQTGQKQSCISTYLVDGSAITWTEDGQTILALVENEEKIQIARIILSDNEITYIGSVSLPPDEEVDEVYWSPSAEKMLYRTVKLQNSAIRGYRLYLLDLNSLQQTFITEDQDGSRASWSSDDERFVAVVDETLVIYDSFGNVISDFVPTYQGQVRNPGVVSWSPNGNKIAFDSNYQAQRVGIYILELDDGNVFQVMDNFFPVGAIAWSPDSEYLAMDPCCPRNAEVVIVSFDGWERWYRLDSDSIDLPTWEPIH